MIVKGDPADGIEDGFDEGSATTLKLEFSNGNLLANGVADTVITAKVYRKGEEVTDEYAATAFNWARTSGNESADAGWNAAHSGMKSITVSANELTDDIQIQCTLTGTSPAYGSVDVNDSFIASHTRGVADSNDTLSLEDGTLFVTTDDDNYRLSGNELTALYPRLNGSVTTNAWVYHTQPLKTIEFKYNSSGLRVQKKVIANGKTETTDYTLHGKLVTHMTVGNDKLHFFYDAQSRPANVNFNGTTYTYLHNLQGDVVGIIDKSGNLVVEYKYDAWGRSISIAGSLADTLGKHNPFRYRGYVYDEEAKFFYLRSRYYNPAVGRFVNADARLDSRGFGANLFGYCAGNPVVRADDGGFAWYNDVLNAIGNAASDAWDWTTNAATDAWDWTTNAATDAWSWTTNAATDAWSWTTNAATDAWNWATNAATDAWNWMTNAATDAWAWTKQAAAGVWNWTEQTAAKVIAYIKPLIHNFKARLKRVDWHKVLKETKITAISSFAAGIASGALAGTAGAAFTAGLSVPSTAFANGVIGFINGAAAGFISAFLEEMLK